MGGDVGSAASSSRGDASVDVASDFEVVADVLDVDLVGLGAFGGFLFTNFNTWPQGISAFDRDVLN
jgi:hypothetical protein